MNITKYLFRKPHSSDGSATITALIVVGVATVVLSGLIWRQEIQMRVLENLREQKQVSWLERSAVDFARLILNEDQRQSKVDHLGEIWAIPLLDGQVGKFLQNTDITEDVSKVVLFGSISDAQALFNLRNLWNESHQFINYQEVEVYARLLKILNLDSRIALQTAEFYRETGYLPADLASVYALPIYQQSEASSLKPFLVLLPGASKVNVNTASAEMLMAVTPGLSRGSANRFMQTRSQKPIQSFNDIISQLSDAGVALNGFPSTGSVDFGSQFWLVKTEIKIKNNYFHHVSLIKRNASQNKKEDATEILWSRVHRG
jgi:general secretion pathway protein K